MNHQTLIEHLYEKQMVKFGDFTLKSGAKSAVYMNLREVIAYPTLLKQVSDLMYAQYVGSKSPTLICGVPYSAMVFATYLSIKHDIPLLIRRKEAKAYGTKQQVEGVFQAGEECLLLEDVITSGKSILETVADLRAVGVVVTQVLGLVDREAGAAEVLAKEGIAFHSVLTMRVILDTLYQMKKIPNIFCEQLGYEPL